VTNPVAGTVTGFVEPREDSRLPTPRSVIERVYKGQKILPPKGTALYNLYNKFDDAGRCANLATKVIHGGCFIEGTLVTVSSLPGQSTSTDSLWSNPSWLDDPSPETPWLASERYATVATRTELQVPIESVPIGARIPTKNPNRSEVDPQPEPDQATWAKLSITAEGSDGGIVDAEIIRPRSWILRNGICAGRMLPFNLPELEVSGLALVTSIDECPPIADGEGSVVTARFVTREVHVVASVDVLGADGTVETITGTTIHPVWSVDRQSWVPLAELADGETLQGLDGLAVVLSVSLSRVSQPVYNIEVHGEHVYQVGELGLVVHNVCDPELLARWGAGSFDDVTKTRGQSPSLFSTKRTDAWSLMQQSALGNRWIRCAYVGRFRFGPSKTTLIRPTSDRSDVVRRRNQRTSSNPMRLSARKIASSHRS